VTALDAKPRPRISVVIPTYNRAELLQACLDSFIAQTLRPERYEVVVIDDGSNDTMADMLKRYSARLRLSMFRLTHSGRSAARNLGIFAAQGDIVLFSDDDSLAHPRLLEEVLKTHDERPEEHIAVLGYMPWAPHLAVTPLMEYVTNIGKCLVDYGAAHHGELLSFTHFWAGCVSCKRSFLTKHGVYDQRLQHTEDIELGYRLSKVGLRVLVNRAAISYLVHNVTFDRFCTRCEEKGEAAVQVMNLHPGDPLVEQACRDTIPGGRDLASFDEAGTRWDAMRPELDRKVERVRELEHMVTATGLVERGELFELYKWVFQAFAMKGVVKGRQLWRPRGSPGRKIGHRVAPAAVPASLGRPSASPGRISTKPLVSVLIPAWNSTPDLARMTASNLERIWQVANVPLEVVVIDNGSRFQEPYRASRIVTFGTNRGVACAWNEGARIARGDVLCFLNSDVYVQDGWDAELCDAALNGRRIAFPYTDLDDGRGPCLAEPAGLAGWCFALSRSVGDEIGTFDEAFSPAFFEDTDYFHRAWLLGIELNPVPRAAVNHVPRHEAIYNPNNPHATPEKTPRMEWLFRSNRLRYGWKHGVEPDAAPPFYLREIVEFAPHRPHGASTRRHEGGGFGDVRQAGRPERMKVAYLTIDDGPSEDMTEKVDFLVSRGIPAVWFCRGDFMEERSEHVLYAIDKGFLIGNHAYSHQHFSDLTLATCLQEIEKTDEVIDDLYRRAGRRRHAKFFRFPFGDKGGLNYSDVMKPFEGEGKERKDRLQTHLKTLGYTQPRFPGITYRYYRDAHLLDDVDWHWTYAVLEFDLFFTPRRFGLDSLEKVLARMHEDEPERCLGLNDKRADDIVLLHDHTESTSVFQPIVDHLLAMGIHFARIPLA